MTTLLSSDTHVGAISTHHLYGGSGDPVLMLHGWGASSALVEPLAAPLARRGYRVFVPDLPGFGQTGLPPVAWSVDDYAQWVTAYLDSQQVERVQCFGHSFGGRIGLILASRYPGRIHKLVLANSAGLRTLPALSTRLRLRLYRLGLHGLQRIGQPQTAERLRAWYSRRFGSADYQAASGVLRETFVKVVNQDLAEHATRIHAPTLLLWGDQDEDTPLAQARRLEQLIPDAGLVVWQGAGHYSYLDRLSEAVQVIDTFFRQGDHSS